MENKFNDSVIAQQIVSNSYNNFYKKATFHRESVIYKNSNERIDYYLKYFADREKVLSVIASGDQIINCILKGTKIIDAFDISVFPKYFLFLKLSAIKTLSKDEYIDFFYSQITSSEKYDDYYNVIREGLDDNNKEFWDSLFDYYTWFEIYNSTLFSSEAMEKNNIIEQNLYLQKEHYNNLKFMIDNIKINTFTGNILSLSDTFKEKYDLVYLSNIINYVKPNEYKNMLSKFFLDNNGIVLTYLYRINKELVDYFIEPNYTFDEFDDSRVGVMIYRK